MQHSPYNVNFCLFCECAYLQEQGEGQGWICGRETCVVNKTIVDWWAQSLFPNPLVISNPPSGFHQVFNIYTEKVGGKYQIRMIVDDVPKE